MCIQTLRLKIGFLLSPDYGRHLNCPLLYMV